MIVSTKHKTFDECETQINHAIKAVEGKERFSNLSITPTEYWRILLYKDKYNYAGIKESDPDKIKVDYDVMTHLPEAVQKKFQLALC